MPSKPPIFPTPQTASLNSAQTISNPVSPTFDVSSWSSIKKTFNLLKKEGVDHAIFAKVEQNLKNTNKSVYVSSVFLSTLFFNLN